MTEWRTRMFSQIDDYLESMKWDLHEAQNYTAAMFQGRRSRHQLDDIELRNLERKLDWCASQVGKVAVDQPLP
jgi:hypothetical protein